MLSNTSTDGLLLLLQDITAVDEEMDEAAKQDQNELHELTRPEPVTA